MSAAGRTATRRAPALPAGRTVIAGILGTASLPGLYLALISLAQGPDHALEQLGADLPFLAAIAIGFGLQVAMFVELRRLHAAAAEARAMTAAGAATSSAAMLACCAHHLVDVLPLLGMSAAAALLAEYKAPLMAISLVTTAAGIVLMAQRLADARRCRAAFRPA